MEIRSKRVLVTGADGFIGSHLVELLAGRSASVRALALYDSLNDWGWLEGLPCLDQIEVVTGDIRDANFCLDLVKGVDVVFHLAALIPIPYSYRAPASYVATNVAGTLNICQAALTANVERLIHTSTSEVYGTARYVPIDESHPLQPQSPYSATKIGADAIAKSFHASFDLPVVIARPFNVYGPRQSARAVIPTIVTQLLSGMETIKLGDTRTTRDFTFVEDTCRGLIALAEMPDGAGEVFNIGSNFEICIGDVFAMAAELINPAARIATDQERLRPANSEVLRLWCNNEKFIKATGFQPEISFRDGLCRTIEWFRIPDHLRRYKPHIYNV